MVWFLIAGFTAVFLSHTAPWPFLLDSFAPSRSVWRMPNDVGPPTVYLTYDDGPNPTATPALLDVLRDSDAHATFFLIDAHLTEATAAIVRRMFAEGHAVALHSDTRALMIKQPEQLAALLTRQADRIEALAGERPCRLFRPHAGGAAARSREVWRGIDYRLVGWSWGLWDWNFYRRQDALSLARRLAQRISPGDIVVMHDGHHVNPNADRQYAVEASANVRARVQSKGYRFGVLCSPGSAG